ncbi:hypothetical protein S83_055913 [Arachis hypogaea]
MNIITWNCRGVGSKGFPRLVKDLCGPYHSNILCLLETRISGTKATNIARKFGFSSWHLVEGVGFSGGIWVLWNDTFWCIEVLESHRQFVYLRIAYQNELPWFLTIVYGSPNIAP